jgi:hypothetical protein
MHGKWAACGLVVLFSMLTAPSAPVALAEDQYQSTSEISLTLSEGGTFALALDVSDNGDVVVPTTTPSPIESDTIRVLIRLTDTKSYRSGFDVFLSATQYTSDMQIPTQPEAKFYQLPADALKISSTQQPRPGRWDFDGPVTDYPIGNIFPTTDDGIVLTSYDPVRGGLADVWESNQTLVGTPRRILHAEPGGGTLESTIEVSVRVTIPPHTTAGRYTCTFMVTSVPAEP